MCIRDRALYDWDFPRQLLHLRTVEAGGHVDVQEVERDLYDRRFLIARPLLQAIETTPSVLLVDEVDRADDEFEAFLLEVLSDFTITVPELGTVRAPGVSALLAGKVVAAVHRLRELDLVKPPGVAETIDWVRTLDVLGERELDPRTIQDTLGAVVKERDDLDLVREHLNQIASGA